MSISCFLISKHMTQAAKKEVMVVVIYLLSHIVEFSRDIYTQCALISTFYFYHCLKIWVEV